MNETIQSVLNLQIPLSWVLAYYIFLALAGGMPKPDCNASFWYKWLYNSMQILAGNLSRLVIKNKVTKNG